MGGYSWAQTLTKVTSLDDINETDSYVLQHYGKIGYNGYDGETYFYAASADATTIACSTTLDTSNKGFLFKFEIDGDTYQIKNELTTNPYLKQTNFVSTPEKNWAIVYNSETQSFGVAFNYSASTCHALYAYDATRANKMGTNPKNLKDYAFIRIFKVQKTKPVNVTINYVDKANKPITSKNFI